jgi:flagellar protein FlaG|tara:strand:- start:455 stop:871 length:417 start_codon:yes stop_codon:yes gene_type:complete
VLGQRQEVVTVIEAAMVNPQSFLKVVDRNADVKAKVAQVDAPIAPQFERAPRLRDVVINREPVISSQELDLKIAQLNEAMVSRNQAVVFSRDEATGKDVLRVNNKSTGELIRQIPNDEALKVTQSIDKMIGLIFNQRA